MRKACLLLLLCGVAFATVFFLIMPLVVWCFTPTCSGLQARWVEIGDWQECGSCGGSGRSEWSNDVCSACAGLGGWRSRPFSVSRRQVRRVLGTPASIRARTGYEIWGYLCRDGEVEVVLNVGRSASEDLPVPYTGPSRVGASTRTAPHHENEVEVVLNVRDGANGDLLVPSTGPLRSGVPRRKDDASPATQPGAPATPSPVPMPAHEPRAVGGHDRAGHPMLLSRASDGTVEVIPAHGSLPAKRDQPNLAEEFVSRVGGCLGVAKAHAITAAHTARTPRTSLQGALDGIAWQLGPPLPNPFELRSMQPAVTVTRICNLPIEYNYSVVYQMKSSSLTEVPYSEEGFRVRLASDTAGVIELYRLRDAQTRRLYEIRSVPVTRSPLPPSGVARGSASVPVKDSGVPGILLVPKQDLDEWPFGVPTSWVAATILPGSTFPAQEPGPDPGSELVESLGPDPVRGWVITKEGWDLISSELRDALGMDTLELKH